MRLLLDAHSLIWAVDQPSKLSSNAKTALQDPNNDLLLSAATIWEIAIKVSLGKLTLSLPYRPWLDKAISDLGLTLLSITLDHAEVLSTLPQLHGDPFDRMLAWQGLVEKVAIVSADAIFDAYVVSRAW